MRAQRLISSGTAINDRRRLAGYLNLLRIVRFTKEHGGLRLNFPVIGLDTEMAANAELIFAFALRCVIGDDSQDPAFHCLSYN